MQLVPLICALTVVIHAAFSAPAMAGGAPSAGGTADALSAELPDNRGALGLAGRIGAEERGAVLRLSLTPELLRGATVFAERGMYRGERSGIATLESVEHEAEQHSGIGVLVPVSNGLAAALKERLPSSAMFVRASAHRSRSDITDRLVVGERAAVATVASKVYTLALVASVPVNDRKLTWFGSIGAASQSEDVVIEIDGPNDVSTFTRDEDNRLFPTIVAGLLYARRRLSAYASVEHSSELAFVAGINFRL